MPLASLLPDFSQLALNGATELDLRSVLTLAADALGFQFFAVAHHPSRLNKSGDGLHSHNYPDAWAARYIARDLGRWDPIRRTSNVWACGFRWHDARKIVPFSKADDAMLADARDLGIDDGFTIPVHVPGESQGSVTFATRVGSPFPERTLLQAHGFGLAAFQLARIIARRRTVRRPAILTDRQLECVVWVARGKSNWEIAHILNVSPDTVKKHLRGACARYELYNRGSLPLRALYEGSICFSDIFP